PITWFGAESDDGQDDTKAIRLAADFAANSPGKTMLIPAGKYRFAGNITLRCNVRCLGVLEKILEVDPAKTKNSVVGFQPLYGVKQGATIFFHADQPMIELDPAEFPGIRAGSLKIPKTKQVRTRDPKRPVIDLEEGGTLLFSSSNFFSSRKNLKGDEYYTPNDCCQLVSPHGDVFPEFCFDYAAPDNVPEWSADTVYKSGDFCRKDGVIFKAIFRSGPDTEFVHPALGKITIGSHQPDASQKETAYHYTYKNGTKDFIRLWLRVESKILYVPPQLPLTVDGLTIEIDGIDPENDVRPIYDSTLSINRSNMTFRRLSISCKNGKFLPSVLTSVSSCNSVVFENCHWSGATQHGLGYNIMHGNCAGITYKNCTSTNARDAIAGRHAKNVLIDGGHFGCIDDHYGLNFTIRNVHLNTLSTVVPGHTTPKGDIRKWYFAPRHSIIIGGGNVNIENCIFYNSAGIFTSRTDIGDVLGTITIRDCTVYTDQDIIAVDSITHPLSYFDYAHKVKDPAKITVDNVTVCGKGKLRFRINRHQGEPFPMKVSNCHPVGGEIILRNVDADFSDSVIDNAKFSVTPDASVSFRDCDFRGKTTGLKDARIPRFSGNLFDKDAIIDRLLEQK
ncbi:MAG: hypothetical protein J6R85_01755, partial [Lentisphaeria bacterium]|nr:hypothetical protein [Lentisphaeria bacterium]